MRQWFHERPWIWIVCLLVFVVGAGFVTLVIAELNKPTIVKPKTTMQIGPLQNESHADRNWIV